MNEMYINDFIDYLKYERKLSPNTIKSYEYNLKQYNNFLKNKNITKINGNDLTNFIKSERNKSKNILTITHHISILCSFYNYLFQENIINTNPATNLIKPKTPKKLPNYLTIEEVDKLLDVKLDKPFDYRYKAMIELAYATGIRVSELISLKLSNIDLENCFIRVMGKGSKERIVPFGDIAYKYLKLYINNYRMKILKDKDSEYLFINYKGQMISRQSFFKFIKNQALKAGIKKNISPHILRHSFATHLLNNGADLKIIQELLGHSDLSTTEIYAHLANEKIKKDYEEYHPHSHE